MEETICINEPQISKRTPIFKSFGRITSTKAVFLGLPSIKVSSKGLGLISRLKIERIVPVATRIFAILLRVIIFPRFSNIKIFLILPVDVFVRPSTSSG